MKKVLTFFLSKIKVRFYFKINIIKLDMCYFNRRSSACLLATPLSYHSIASVISITKIVTSNFCISLLKLTPYLEALCRCRNRCYFVGGRFELYSGCIKIFYGNGVHFCGQQCKHVCGPALS